MLRAGAPRLVGSSTIRTSGWAARTAAAVPSVEPLSTRITGASWHRSEPTRASRRSRDATTTVTRADEGTPSGPVTQRRRELVLPEAEESVLVLADLQEGDVVVAGPGHLLDGVEVRLDVGAGGGGVAPGPPPPPRPRPGAVYRGWEP